jgi:hypothetical protein
MSHAAPAGLSYRFIDYDLGHELPQLVLACSAWEQPAFKQGHEWVALAHQCGGLACHHRHLLGTLLEISPSAREGIERICSHWYDSQLGAFGALLDDVELYRSQLRDWLGVECNRSYGELEEAFYPVDCTPEALARLSSERLPENLDALVEWDSDLERLGGSFGRWGLYILGSNSD